VMAKEPGFELDDETRQGLLQSGFVVGFAVASPIFAHLSHRIPGNILMSVGLFAWVASAAVAGFAWHYYVLLVARILIGVGEAAFASLAPAEIDDLAPPARRALWMGIFFSSIPIGQAAGYGGAGVIAKYLGWRYTFYFEAAAMLPFAIILLCMKPVAKQVTKKEDVELADDADAAEMSARFVDDATSHTAPPTAAKTLVALWSNTPYVLIVLGYAALVSVTGSLGLYMPDYITTHLAIDASVASVEFGATLACAGLVGTVVGGVLADMGKRTGSQRVLHMMRIITLALIVGTPVGICAVWFGNSPVVLYCVLFLSTCARVCCRWRAQTRAGLSIVFLHIGPINSIILALVDKQLRGPAMAVSIFALHALGDLPSPVLVGEMLKYAGPARKQLVIAALLGVLWITALFWAAAYVTYRRVSRVTRSAWDEHLAIAVLKDKRVVTPTHIIDEPEEDDDDDDDNYFK
jgi:MFS family permease